MNGTRKTVYAGIIILAARGVCLPAAAQNAAPVTDQQCETALRSSLAAKLDDMKADREQTGSSLAKHSAEVIGDTLAGLENPDHLLDPKTAGENGQYFNGSEWRQSLALPEECNAYAQSRLLGLRKRRAIDPRNDI
jgi:hypothetical protein